MIGPITHISLCTGYGGLELGLHKALCNLKTIAYCDIELFSCINLMAKMEQGMLEPAPIWSNLKTFPWVDYKDRTDLLTGGFPCQPFSTSGRREADADPKHLWPFIVKGIQDLNYPSIVFFENVAGIASAKLKGKTWSDPENTSVLLHILRELERNGYYASAGIFSATEVGAVQERARYFIMGIHKDISSSRLKDIESMRLRNESYTTNDSISNSATESGDVLNTTQFKSIEAWPQPRGATSYVWEPPKLIDSATAAISDLSSFTTQRSDPTKTVELSSHLEHINTCDFDFAEASVLYTSLVDEGRMLGNGIVPAVSQKAFNVLYDRIINENNIN